MLQHHRSIPFQRCLYPLLRIKQLLGLSDHLHEVAVEVLPQSVDEPSQVVCYLDGAHDIFLILLVDGLFQHLIVLLRQPLFQKPNLNPFALEGSEATEVVDGASLSDVMDELGDLEVVGELLGFSEGFKELGLEDVPLVSLCEVQHLGAVLQLQSLRSNLVVLLIVELKKVPYLQ